MNESGRKLPDLVEAFVEYLRPCETPASFKLWAALGLVAGALERRCWAWGRGFKIHPNLFILLIAPPGVGKNVAIDPVNELWSAAGCFNIITNRSTLPAFIENVGGNMQFVDWEGERVLTNPACMALGEFGHFFKEKDTEMLNAINAFYDAKDVPFVDRTISRGVVTVDKPIMTIVTGTQPQYLDRVLPESAFQMGFATRLVMHYESQGGVGQVFGKIARPQKSLFDAIVHDLVLLKSHVGQYEFANDAADLFEEWYQSGCAPKPDHPRLLDYCTRRWASAFKLCIIFSAARSNDLIIQRWAVEKAIALLLKAESTLPDAFAAMRGFSDNAIIIETYNYVFKEFTHKKLPVRENQVMAFLATRTQAHRIKAILDTMIVSGMLVEEGQWPAGMRLFKPGDRSNLL